MDGSLSHERSLPFGTLKSLSNCQQLKHTSLAHLQTKGSASRGFGFGVSGLIAGLQTVDAYIVPETGQAQTQPPFLLPKLGDSAQNFALIPEHNMMDAPPVHSRMLQDSFFALL